MKRSRKLAVAVAVAAGLGAGSCFVALRPEAASSPPRKAATVVHSPPGNEPAIAAISSAALDPATRAMHALALSPGPTQDRAIREAARDFVRRYPAHAIEWALKLEDAAPRGAALDEITRELVVLDPRRTVAALAKLPPGLGADEALSSAAGHWVKRDAPAAFAWLREVPDASVRARLLGGMGFELAEIDPRRALGLAAESFTGEERMLLAAGVVAAWSARDSQAALAWAYESSDPAVGAQRLGQVIAGLAQSTPSQAASLLDRVPAGALQTSAALAVAKSWSARDPSGAAAWVTSLPDSPLRAGLAAAVVADWSSHSPATAGAWVRALPPGSTRDAALVAHVEALKVEHIAAAARWLGSMPPGERPTHVFAEVAREWVAIEPEVARRWLEEHGIAHQALR